MTQRIKEELHRKFTQEDEYKPEWEKEEYYDGAVDNTVWIPQDMYDEPYEEEEDDIENLDRESYRAYKDAERDISRHKHW
jgi:hypothetical protein